MSTMDDMELLQAYARDRSEAAFGQLVERHLAWVYSVALRHVGTTSLAEEVAQSVFVLLAQKAGSLRSGTRLGGWLFRTTRFVASRALRAEQRRKRREQAAASMSSTTFSDGDEAAWRQLEPYLDQAVAALSENDRQAILLRFFDRQPLQEVGRRLGLTEDAAKKRVSRAIQKLRGFLVRRGVTVSATLLVGLLARQTVQAAPVTLARLVIKAAAAEAATGGLPALARETLQAWRWAQVKFAGGIAAALGGLVGLCLLLASPSGTSSGLTQVPAAGGAGVAALPGNSLVVPSAGPVRSVAATKGRVLHFRVLAKDTGEPVRGAGLAVNTVSQTGGAAGWKERFDLATDAEGGADVWYPADTGRLDVGVMASGWAARFATWWRDESELGFPTDYTLRVDRLTNYMGGWLRDEKGRPVADATVEMEFVSGEVAQEETPRERNGFVGPAPVARSDRLGWWTCALIPPTARRIPALRARHPDFAVTRIAPGKAKALPDTSMESLWRGQLVTTMDRGVVLAGRILTEEGRPIAEARVEHEPASFDAIATQSDAQGGFAFRGLSAGRFDFFVTAPGFAQTNVTVALKADSRPLELRLQPGGVLRLQLVDEDGNPVPDGWAAVTGPGGVYLPDRPGIHWNAESGPDGRIEWTSAPADRFLSISAGAPDLAPSCVVARADGEEHVIRLARVFVFSGRVTDARTGALLREPIKVYPGYDKGTDPWCRGEMRRSVDGLFRLGFAGPAPWRFRVEAEGYSPFVSGLLRRDSNRAIAVALQPADPSRAIRGNIRRADGRPAAGAQVALLTPEHGACLGRACFTGRERGDRLIVNADEAGKFSFPEQLDASFVVAVGEDGFARVPVGDVTTALEIELAPWGRIEGAIAPSARTRPVARVRVDDLRAMDLPASLSLDAREFQATPGEDGRFSFEGIPPGPCCVWLDAGVIEDPHVPPCHHPAWVTVKPGETAQVTISEIGCHVKGRFIVSGHNGNRLNSPLYAVLLSSGSVPAPGLAIAPGTKYPFPSMFDELGRLLIESNGQFQSRNPLPPGTYRLLGRIDGIRLDRDIEVPNSPANDFLNADPTASDADRPVIDLGDILVTGGESAGASTGIR